MLIFADMVGGWVGVAIFQYLNSTTLARLALFKDKKLFNPGCSKFFNQAF